MLHVIDVLVLIAFILVQGRITFVLLRAARRRWSGRNLTLARWAVAVWDGLLALGYLATLSRLLSTLHIPPGPAMVFGAGALAYLMIAAVVLAIHTVMTLVKLPFDPGRRRALDTAGRVLMAAPVAAVGYGALVERLNFGVREVEIPIPDLPADLDGLRVLHLSDIHLSVFLSESEFARVIDASNELRPQIAFVTGDLISSRGDPLDACIRQIARLKSDAGIYGCMGNHERYSDAEDYTQAAAARFGIPFLRSRNTPLRFGNTALNVAGVDYQPWSRRGDYLRGAGRLRVPGAFNVLLSHNPDVFPVAAAQGYNLLLAGHTHGGQVQVEILDRSISAARFFTPFVYGLYRRGDAAAYVTRGIGTIGIPARIGAPPEISLLRLRKA